MRFLFLIVSIALLYGFISHSLPTGKIEIIVCKDKVKRLFFAGEKRDFKRFKSVFNKDTCKLNVLTEEKWLRILYTYQKRSVKKP